MNLRNQRSFVITQRAIILLSSKADVVTRRRKNNFTPSAFSLQEFRIIL